LSIRTSSKVTKFARHDSTTQRGISGVTIAVVAAALAVVTLTIVQAATSGDASAAQAGIPGLIG